MEAAAADPARATWAVLPIALVLVLMLGFGWSAARAGLAALAAGVVLALSVFDLGAPAPSAWAPFVGVGFEAIFATATILWILWPALALHGLQERIGALAAVRNGLSQITPVPVLQALVIGWFMALFFEGAAGFGTPVALAAPLLVGLGMRPVQAVTVALLGHAVGVSFGALGTPVLTQAALTGLDARQIAWQTALLHAVAGFAVAAAFARLLASGWIDPASTTSAAAVTGWVALAAALFLGGSLLLAWWIGPEIATLGAALAGGVVLCLLLRLRTGVAQGNPQRGLLRAFWPYLVLVGAVLLMRGVVPLHSSLSSVAIEWSWLGAFSGRMLPLTHPGTLLFLALLGGAALQGAAARDVARALRDAARRLVPVMVALLAMLGLSRLMLHAGMVAALEAALVALFGRTWPIAAPALGALGSFVTGSATASNVLFSTLQVRSAEALGLPGSWLAAAQSFGAALGNVICPHNVVAGAATVGLAGRESDILRRTAVPCVAGLAAGGLAVVWLAGRA